MDGHPGRYRKEAFFAVRDLVAVLIYYSGDHPRYRLAHRSWSYRHAWIVADHMTPGLGLPPGIMYPLAHRSHGPSDDLGVQGFADRTDVAQL